MMVVCHTLIKADQQEGTSVSKGNPIIKCRVSRQQLEEITAALERRNKQADAGAMTITEWLREAIDEKLEHQARARKARSGKLPEWFWENAVPVRVKAQFLHGLIGQKGGAG